MKNQLTFKFVEGTRLRALHFHIHITIVTKILIGSFDQTLNSFRQIELFVLKK